MPKPLSLDPFIKQLRQRWQELPDYRQPSNNTQYTIADAALAAFSVFFMPSPSFLAHQRDVQQRKGRSNAGTLFGLEKIPTDNQIRNLLDPITPDHFHDDFEWVIDELERHRRGPYAGAVGYFDFAGNMDTCIALRTLVVQGNKAYIQVGAGIVADSDPKSEYEETLNKARGLLKAIEITEARVRGSSTS